MQHTHLTIKKIYVFDLLRKKAPRFSRGQRGLAHWMVFVTLTTVLEATLPPDAVNVVVTGPGVAVLSVLTASVIGG